MRTFKDAASLGDSVGQPLGTSSWRTLDLPDFVAFGQVSGDDGWIHTDPGRAGQDAGVGGVIAQGSLLVSLVVPLSHQVFRVASARRVLNYGFDRLRFTSPVPAGARVRLHLTLKGMEARSQGGAKAVLTCTLEAESNPRPAMVGDWTLLIVES